MEESNVQKFYKSRNVFITGGTGFMGKILIEKLLRSTEVSTLYVLVREKKGKNVHTRIDELFDDVVFDRLKSECPKFKHRIEAISGDCSVTGLGLNITDRQTLLTNIDVIFHMAATVRFDENLKLAYSINVDGTKGVLEMARQMPNLKSLIHVSTAYAHCHLEEIDEKLYDCPYTYEDVGAALEKMSKNEAALVTPRILGPWPNTYTFTKALAESVIKKRASGLPMGIYRPAIVLSTYKEPLEGWVDNLYGPTGLCAGGMSGICRVLIADGSKVADVIPVDTCVAGLIASAWDVANRDYERTPEKMPVYNYVSSIENPLTWNEFLQINLMSAREYPLMNTMWYTSVTITCNRVYAWFLRLFLHILPALVFDIGAVISGNKPRMLQIYRKVHKVSDVLDYFCVRDWIFSNKNTINLWEKMNSADKELFPMSMTTVHWLHYFRRYTRGVRLYMLKDPDATLDAAKRRSKRLYILHEAAKIILVYTACLVVSSLCSKAFYIFF